MAITAIAAAAAAMLHQRPNKNKSSLIRRNDAMWLHNKFLVPRKNADSQSHQRI